ncbi:hypothetical protein ABGB07_34240 [Micromonosporaceae bacterium B7E4]
MSFDCRAYGVYEAAWEQPFCRIHHEDERVLHLDLRTNLDRAADEIEDLKLFVQAVKEHRSSAHWHPPTGFITGLVNGRTVRTRQRSLPL